MFSEGYTGEELLATVYANHLNLRDVSSDDRKFIADALSEMADAARAVMPVLIAAFQAEPVGFVKFALLQTFKELGGDEARAAIQAAAVGDKSGMVRREAESIAIELGIPLNSLTTSLPRNQQAQSALGHQAT